MLTSYPIDPTNATEKQGAASRHHRTRIVPLTDLRLPQFDSLLNIAHVRRPAVKGWFGCTSATVWRGVKTRETPKPTKFGGLITAWNVGELRRTLSGAEKVAIKASKKRIHKCHKSLVQRPHRNFKDWQFDADTGP